jgi:fimbrial chaperone protein
MYPGSTESLQRSAPAVTRSPRATAWGVVCGASGPVAVLAISLALLTGVAFAQPRLPADAPQFNITPTRVFIPAGQTNASLVVRNDGAEPLRFQITASGWSNDADGQLVLHATTDVVFFPMLFNVEPGQSRRIRIAVTARAIERELSYRLFIEQLPSRAGTQTAGVQMLMRASIPVFVQPPRMIAQATLDKAVIATGQLSFAVHNIGTVHVSIARVTVHAPRRDATQPPFESTLPGWYLLSGETRTYRVALPADVCRERPTLTIAATFADNADPLTIVEPIPAGACEP